MLLGFLSMLFVAAEAEVSAIAAPLFHLPRDRGGRTLLVCLVSDLLQDDVEVSWISSRAAWSNQTFYSILREDDGSHSAMSIVSVAFNEWESFTCFVSYTGLANLKTKHYIGVSKHKYESTCLDYQPNISEDIFSLIRMQTDAIVIVALRILLLKSTIFNFLVTTRVIMYSGDIREEQSVTVELERVLTHSLACRVHFRQGV